MNSNYRFVTGLIAASAMSAPAFAQQPGGSIPPAASVLSVNPKHVRAVPAPPPWVDPVTAPSNVRAQYGLPPVLPESASPSLKAKWLSGMAALKKQSSALAPAAAPIMTETNLANGPNKIAPVTSPSPSTSVAPSTATPLPGGASFAYASSNNWSGTAVVDASNPFSVEAVAAEFTVPYAHQGIGKCSGGWIFSSLWPGIDGYGSPDVLQAGVESDAYCNNGTISTYYSAWIEWYPYNETRVSSPAVNPGDEIYVQVWNTTATTGYAYIYNASTGVAASYSLTAPSGTVLRGNSVEWIVERPGVGGSLATLTNYTGSAWPYGLAWNYAAASPTYIWQGNTAPANGTFYQIQMLDNAGAGISWPVIENYNFLWFSNYGSSR